MTRIIVFLFTLVLTCSVSLFAGNDVDAILSKLEKKYNGLKDATASFTQTIEFGVTKSKQSFEGKLFMKKGNRYRIELEDQTIVTDGTSVWSYAKSTNQVVIDTYKDDPKSFSPDKVLVNVPDRYTTTLLLKEKRDKMELTVLKMIPKDKTSNVKWMKVWVDEDETLMRKIQIMDVSDNLTTYDIGEIHMNEGLADSRFQFEAPKGADVIDLR